MKRRRQRRVRYVEQLETRCCLSAVTWLGHKVDHAKGSDFISGDVDADGDQDLVIYEALPTGKLKMLLNDGEGAFAESQEIPVGHVCHCNDAIHLVDVDKDGDLDVFFAGQTSGRVLVNDGLGSFTEDQSKTRFRGELTAIAFGDFDGDGYKDAIFGTSSGIRLFINNGGGEFAIGQMLGEVVPQSMAVGDLDDDGDLDVYAATFRLWGPTPDQIWLNDGQGEFSLGEHATPLSTSTVFVRLGDLDGDDDLDALLFGYQETSIWWNDASGGLLENAVNPTLPRLPFFLVDIDDDNDLDVIGNGILMNTGDGRFEKLSARDTRFRAVAAADFDGDGDTDFLGANSWWERRFIGDSNDDGVFDSSDLVAVLAAGKFGTISEAAFDEGDWNQDGFFNSSDIVFAFQAGTYASG